MRISEVSATAWVGIGVSALFATTLLSIWLLTDGSFSYSLDDAYIHLALARQLADGHYGLEPSSFAAPSSSILWPFLMASANRAGLGVGGPLFVNWLCTLGLGASLAALLPRLLAFVRGSRASLVATVMLVVLAIGAVPVAFFGLEHSLQLLVTAELARRLFGVDKDAQRWSSSLIVFLVLGPLIRYENLGLSLAVALFVWPGTFRSRVVVSLACCAPAVVFGLFLLLLGLEPIPSSILAKKSLDTSSLLGLFSSVATNFGLAVTRLNRGQLLSTCLVILSVAAMFGAQERRRLRWAGAIATLCHLFAGGYGRYELYIWLFDLLLLIDIFGASFTQRAISRSKSLAVLAVALGFGGAPYLGWLFQAPFGARSIWAQQGSMVLVTRVVGEPIALNDIGLVSYASGVRVLDLWGLGSEAARRARLRGTVGWVGATLDESDVELAMVYPNWFAGQLPRDLQPVLSMTYLGPWPSTAEREVVLYTRRALAGRTRERLLEIVPEIEARGNRVEVNPPHRTSSQRR